MLLSQKKVAVLLGVSIQTLEQWRVRGYGLPFIKVGHLVRYRPEDVDRFISTNTRHSTKKETVGR